MRYIDYYGKSISKENFEKAYDFYLDYMESNKLNIEFSEEDFDNIDFDDIEESILTHVVYHAELNDFEIDDYLI